VDINKEVCACFAALEHVKWTKLMHILKETGNDWQKRRMISKLYMKQGVKV